MTKIKTPRRLNKIFKTIKYLFNERISVGRKNFDIIAILILSLLCVIILYSVTIARYKEILSKSSSNTEDVDFDRSLSLASIEAEGEKFDDIFITDTAWDHFAHFCTEHIGKIFFRIPAENCLVCIDTIIGHICRFGVNLTENFFILGSFQDKHSFLVFKETIPCNIPLINLQTNTRLNYSLEKSGTPYFFLLNKDFCLTNVFIPDKYYPEGTKTYLEIIYKKLNIKK